MKLHPRLSRAGIELVMRFEGLRQKAARLPNGGWTVGYGHTLSAREGVELSAADARALLLYDLNQVAYAIDETVFTPLNQNQFDALTSFAFNVGLDNFRRSKVVRRLNEGAYLEAAAAIELWRKSEIDGESIVVDALVRRRAAEKTLFLTPPEGFRPVPTPVVPPDYDYVADLPLVNAGLAEAADVRVSLLGDLATAEVHPSERRLAAGRRRLVSPPSRPVEPEPPPFPRPENGAAESEREAHGPVLRRRYGAVEIAREPTAHRFSLMRLVLGVFGAAMFLLALATIVLGRPTLVNLSLGLLGVACMVPVALRLLSGVSGEGRLGRPS